MTIAQQIKSFYINNTVVDYNALCEELEQKAVSVEQDFDAESTTYIFADDSVLVNCGSFFETYGSAGTPREEACRSGDILHIQQFACALRILEAEER